MSWRFRRPQCRSCQLTWRSSFSPHPSPLLRGPSMLAGPRAVAARAVASLPAAAAPTSQSNGLQPATVCLGSAAAVAAAALLAPAPTAASAEAEAKADDSGILELYKEEQRTVSLFKRCSTSVVHINTFKEKQGLVRDKRGYRLDLMEIPQGTGSGFVWDDKHIVTNYHVIMDSNKAIVVFADQSTCDAALVGSDPDCDLAVLRVVSSDQRNGTTSKTSMSTLMVAPPKDSNIQPHSARSLQPLERGSSAKLQVGQRVLAIGNPFGLDQTLTGGIVSGLGREMRGVTGRVLRGLIQTDAAINPGNSGGPLLDARGRLIGINTMIASPSGAFAGVGFAIPVDTVVHVVQKLLECGFMPHAYLGVYCTPEHVVEQISRRLNRLGLPEIKGVLVLSIEPDSPAAKAGLRPTVQTRDGLELGDELIAVAGSSIQRAEDLVRAVDSFNVGESIEITYLRRTSDGDVVESARRVEVRLAQRPTAGCREAAPGGAPFRGGGLPWRQGNDGLAEPRSRL